MCIGRSPPPHSNPRRPGGDNRDRESQCPDREVRMCFGKPHTSWPGLSRPSTRSPSLGRVWPSEMPGSSPGMTMGLDGSCGSDAHSEIMRTSATGHWVMSEPHGPGAHVPSGTGTRILCGIRRDCAGKPGRAASRPSPAPAPDGFAHRAGGLADRGAAATRSPAARLPRQECSVASRPASRDPATPAAPRAPHHGQAIEALPHLTPSLSSPGRRGGVEEDPPASRPTSPLRPSGPRRYRRGACHRWEPGRWPGRRDRAAREARSQASGASARRLREMINSGGGLEEQVPDDRAK